MQNSGTADVREALRFDEAALSSYLQSNLDGFEGPLEVRQFNGGQSNPTYLLSARSGRYVLRRKPPGTLLASAHAVDREYRVLRALSDTGVPVPAAYLYCDDAAVIGTEFFVMQYLDGRIFWELDLPGLSRDERAAIYDSTNETIARLHSIDVDSVGLSDYGKAGNYFERQLSRWIRQYRASETQTIEPMDRLIGWLPAHIPIDDSSSLVHGDYRLDNIVIHPERPEVIGVLDWELSTVGHPLADFTYHLMLWHMGDIGIGAAGLAEHDFDALGIPDADAYAARYCERTGRDGIDDLPFYFAFNLFRLGAILQGIAGRVRDGTAASRQAGQAIRAVEPLARLGADFAGL